MVVAGCDRSSAEGLVVNELVLGEDFDGDGNRRERMGEHK